MNIEKVRNYAKLIARSGLNIQKGQDVFLRADIEILDFVRILVEELYDAGAQYVDIEWTDSEITKTRIAKGDLKRQSRLTTYEKAKFQYIVDKTPCRLFIESEDPDGLAGVDIKKYSQIIQSRGKTIKKYSDKYFPKCQWCIAGYPGAKWAKKVFPELDVEEAKEKLLDLILKTSRADEGDPIENWEKHDKNLKNHAKILNDLKIRTLKYSSSNGTNFSIELNKGVIWEGGSEQTSESKVIFQPNIPSEEVFTSPNKFTANGIVYSSKPLSYQGQLIEDFSLTFENGKVVKVQAKKGEQVLKRMIKSDKNACYLGEVALVPYSSPINMTNKLFFSTLYDENASCHLALGEAFKELAVDMDKTLENDKENYPLNDSIIHVDFMIGTKDLKVVGIPFDSDEEIVIMENGEFAI